MMFLLSLLVAVHVLWLRTHRMTSNYKLVIQTVGCLTVGAIGSAVTWLTEATSGVASGKFTLFADQPSVTTPVAVGAGASIIAILANTIVSGLVNGYKIKKDTDFKIGESEARNKADNEKHINDALKIADEKFIRYQIETEILKQQEREDQNLKMFTMQLQIAELKGQVNRTKESVNTNTEAVKTLGESTGTPLATSEALSMESDNDLPVLKAVDQSLPKLLIVEDNEGLRTLLQRLLTMNGWDILIVESGLEMISELKGGKFCPDVVAVDLKLPDTTGVEIIKYIRKKKMISPQTKLPLRIIAYTACREGDELVNQARDAGADAFLYKPVDLDQFANVVLGRKSGDNIPTYKGVYK